MADFLFRECEWDGCLFRFPAEAEQEGAQRCPRCGSATRVAAVTPVFAPPPGVNGSKRSISGLLDNIRSIHNVGSIFRSADGARLQHLYLSGITATPSHPKLSKAALGAQERVAWTHSLNGPRLGASLRDQGFQLMGIETAVAAQSLYAPRLVFDERPLVIIAGNERAGIDPDLLALCDHVLALPMGGSKRSLNVAVAFGIVAYQLRFGPALRD